MKETMAGGCVSVDGRDQWTRTLYRTHLCKSQTNCQFPLLETEVQFVLCRRLCWWINFDWDWNFRLVCHFILLNSVPRHPTNNMLESFEICNMEFYSNLIGSTKQNIILLLRRLIWCYLSLPLEMCLLVTDVCMLSDIFSWGLMTHFITRMKYNYESGRISCLLIIKT